jgi:hypothetical protein
MKLTEPQTRALEKLRETARRNAEAYTNQIDVRSGEALVRRGLAEKRSYVQRAHKTYRTGGFYRADYWVTEYRLARGASEGEGKG